MVVHVESLKRNPNLLNKLFGGAFQISDYLYRQSLILFRVTACLLIRFFVVHLPVITHQMSSRLKKQNHGNLRFCHAYEFELNAVVGIMILR